MTRSLRDAKSWLNVFVLFAVDGGYRGWSAVGQLTTMVISEAARSSLVALMRKRWPSGLTS
jgi:hypothetical protein